MLEVCRARGAVSRAGSASRWRSAPFL
jgi:hypothetical protein